jgi:mitochondrial GTPase 1
LFVRFFILFHFFIMSLYLFIFLAPAYLQILPASTPPTADVSVFLDQLAKRLGMLKRGGERDISRAAVWFVKWWREEGGLASALAPEVSSLPVGGVLHPRRGWGFDFEWSVGEGESVDVQRKMEECIDEYLVSVAEDERDGSNVSSTRVKRGAFREKIAKRRAKSKTRASR